MRRAKIVATIGPASESEDRLRALMLAGMDVARINMSHGVREHHGEVIARIRSVADELNKPVARDARPFRTEDSHRQIA